MKDETLVNPEDEEVMQDEQTDELASYFKCERIPKVLITTSSKPKSFVSKVCKLNGVQFLHLFFIFYWNEMISKWNITN